MPRSMLSWMGLLTGFCICSCSAILHAEENASAAGGQSSQQANEAAIRRALDDKTEIEFVETPLADVVQLLKDQHKIQIRLDKKALDNAGLGSDTPVTCSLKDISLRSALRLMLKEFDLTWVIENEVLLITTIDEAGQKLDAKVYDVADLVTTEDGVDYDSLIETITSIVAPTTWDEVGGPGSIASLHRMIVLNQTAAVHEQVAALLAELRRVRKERGDKIAAVQPVNAVPIDPQALSVKVYRVSVPMMPRPVTTKPAAAKPEAAKPATEKPAAAVPNPFGVNRPIPAQALAQFGSGGMGGMGGGGVGRGWGGVPNDRYLTELAVAIPNLVQPESWINNGGQGTVYALPADADGNGQLLVRQTGEVHAQLQRFLSELSHKSDTRGGFGSGVGHGLFY